MSARSAKTAWVLSGDGINCERETAHALSLVGFKVAIRPISDLIAEKPNLKGLRQQVALIALPGGFSFGDDLGSGRVLALKIKHALGWDLAAYARDGGLVIGICNGFQALIRLGVFGADLSITHNASGKFLDTWVELRPGTGAARSVWCSGVDSHWLPIRHGEGRIVWGEGAREGVHAHAVLRYAQDCNGSADQIAGLCDATGRILGLMPHPEAFVRMTQAPDWTRDPSRAQDAGAGLAFFKNAFAAGDPS